MKEKIRRVVGLWIVMGIFWAASPASGRVIFYEGDWGRLWTSGFFRVQADIHTGPRNPNNPGLEGNDLQFFRQWLLADTTWETPIPHVKLFTRTRIWSDTTADADGKVPDFDAFPTDFRGDGWFGRTSSEDVAAELWEAWFDYSYRDLWIRVGRQTIVWGDVAPTRLLDDINPLDVSWHLVLEPLGKDVFDNLRIPIWATRAAYTLPFASQLGLTQLELEGYVAPDFAFVSTQIPEVGSPLNLVGLPPFIKLRDNIKDGQTGVSAGVRLVGLIGSLNFSLNWITRHNGEGITKTEGFDPDPSSPIGGILRLVQQHPRFDTVGLSFNYFEQWSKAVTRFEAAWDIARPWEDMSTGGIIRRHQWGYVIAIDRPTFTIRRDRTTSLTLQFEQRLREDGRGAMGSAGFPVDRNGELFTVLISQPFPGFRGRYDEYFLDFAMIADLDDSYIFVPLFRFEPGSNWRFNIWHNFIRGPNSHAPTNGNPGGFGLGTWQQGLNVSVSYQF